MNPHRPKKNMQTPQQKGPGPDSPSQPHWVLASGSSILQTQKQFIRLLCSRQKKTLTLKHTIQRLMFYSYFKREYVTQSSTLIFLFQKRDLCELLLGVNAPLALTVESLRGGAKAGCSAPIGWRIVAGSWAGLSPRQTRWPRPPAGPRSICPGVCEENVWMHWVNNNDYR